MHREAAPPVTAPINYDPANRKQTEINALRSEIETLRFVDVRLANENQEQRRLLELQAAAHQKVKDEVDTLRTEIEALRSVGVRFANENQEQQRLLES